MEPSAGKPLDLAAVRAARELLEAVVADRGLLATLPEDERNAFVMAAGRVAHPLTHELRKAARGHRKVRRQERREADRLAIAAAAIREARQAPVYVAPAPAALPGPEAADAARELKTARYCYVCKAPYSRVHQFYDSMCPACAELNYTKRFQTAPLPGRVALVTGGRVKIGFQIVTKLLRAGARVVVTTRFPHDGARRFAAEPDAADWKDRLDVVGLDLRHAPSVERFAAHAVATWDRLDVVINNAAQTVRRPPGFYAHLLPLELQPPRELPALARRFVDRWHDLRAELGGHDALPHAPGEDPALLAPASAPGRAVMGLLEPARLAQLRTATDGEDGFAVFPVGRTDQDEQQVDLRRMNSWRMALGDVPAWEMLEVQLVNAVAPFILNSQLKPLLLRDRTDEKHIVNVSAMEGSFSRKTKTDKHPHTNMAKAALNMMTLTSAPDYAKDGIFMNAVDTGWVTDEDPAHQAAHKRDVLGFEPPLDIVDGAARVLDPLFSGLLTGTHSWGKFLKDYAPTEW